MDPDEVVRQIFRAREVEEFQELPDLFRSLHGWLEHGGFFPVASTEPGAMRSVATRVCSPGGYYEIDLYRHDPTKQVNYWFFVRDATGKTIRQYRLPRTEEERDQGRKDDECPKCRSVGGVVNSTPPVVYRCGCCLHQWRSGPVLSESLDDRDAEDEA